METKRPVHNEMQTARLVINMPCKCEKKIAAEKKEAFTDLNRCLEKTEIVRRRRRK